jgi:hypothetical protein
LCRPTDSREDGGPSIGLIVMAPSFTKQEQTITVRQPP